MAKLGGRPLPTVGIHRGEEEDQKDIADGESEEDSEAPLPEGLPMIEFILPYQRWFYVFYNSTPIQLITAALIFSNFIINAAEAQYCGSNSSCFVDEDGFKVRARRVPSRRTLSRFGSDIAARSRVEKGSIAGLSRVDRPHAARSRGALRCYWSCTGGCCAPLTLTSPAPPCPPRSFIATHRAL